jgi:carbon monoxide dehydrogenase subunit G
VALVAAAALAVPGPAVAAEDEMSQLLRSGPLVRIEQSKQGDFRRALSIADIDAPEELVWHVLTDFDSYRWFMPRIKRLGVSHDGADTLVAFTLDTPIVSTAYTNRYTPDRNKKVLYVRTERGDLNGSNFIWRVVKLSDERTRIYYSGVVQNFSAIAERMDDEQQTITIGINVVSLLSAIKAVQVRSESMYTKNRKRWAPASARRRR